MVDSFGMDALACYLSRYLVGAEMNASHTAVAIRNSDCVYVIPE
jgi:hypothetical protein